MSDPVRVEDFKKLAALVNAYELQPGKHYLIICDGKNFSHGLANRLFDGLRHAHPELTIEVVATLKPKSIIVGEKNEDRTGDGNNPGERS